MFLKRLIQVHNLFNWCVKSSEKLVANDNESEFVLGQWLLKAGYNGLLFIFAYVVFLSFPYRRSHQKTRQQIQDR